jgi:hypothetical protein
MAKRKTAAVATEPTRAEMWQAFIAELTGLFVAYNGKLWKVRRAGEIAAAANLVANTLALFGFSRQ